MGSYADFLAAKTRRAGDHGTNIEPADVHPLLHAWQRDAVAWAVRKGRCALFWDCGLGKTFAQVEWARHSADTALIVAPLSVARQTVREAARIDAQVRYVRDQADVTGPGLWITNYEMADRFEPAAFGAVVLDESSILKNVDGRTRRALTEQFVRVPRRLACTATPAPNDVAELTNHAEFLGVMSRAEMLAAYFVNDEKAWRLKGHAAGPMFAWMASWAHALRSPADMGYPDDGYRLPPLEIHSEIVSADVEPQDGQLFATDLGGVGGRAKVRKQTLGARVERVVDLVNGSARIQPSVERGEPRARPGVPTSHSGAPERSAPGEVRRISRGASEEGRGDRGVPEGQPASPPGNAVRPDGAGARSNAHGGMRGVRGTSAQASHRPLSHDGDDQGSPVPAVQPGAGTSGRRSAASAGPSFVPDDSAWIIWCGLNEEQEALARAFGDRAISITGSLSPEEKEKRLVAWLDGERPILLSKPSICGFGLNLQRAHKMIFLGLGDSYEAYYQAIRRCWRFGQTQPVDVHVVVSEIEQRIVANVHAKEREASRWTGQLVAAMNQTQEATAA